VQGSLMSATVRVGWPTGLADTARRAFGDSDGAEPLLLVADDVHLGDVAHHWLPAMNCLWANMRTMKRARSLIFEIDDLRRRGFKCWSQSTSRPGQMGKSTLKFSTRGLRRRHQWVPEPAPGAGRVTPMRLPAPGSPLPLEREQAIEERAIASECLPQILGCGLLAV